jgi:hypothetical protein
LYARDHLRIRDPEGRVARIVVFDADLNLFRQIVPGRKTAGGVALVGWVVEASFYIAAKVL